MSFIVSEKWLKQRLESQDENTVVIDVRFNMAKPESGEKMYRQEHIPRAVYLDINKDLSGPVEKHGGGHPLPEVNLLAHKLGKIGVNHNKTVVIYDQDNGMFAGRAWWVLHYLGHEKVYVLDGGFKKWVETGNDVTNKISEKVSTTFETKVLKEAIVDMEQVKENIKRETAILIDSRARNRYLGKEEPMYAKAGHIPGAKSYFWKDVVSDDGTYKNNQELANHFSALPKEAEIIVSCGSGISACPNILALKTLGYENVKLYPGSFSDWISYEANELETKEE